MKLDELMEAIAEEPALSRVRSILGVCRRDCPTVYGRSEVEFSADELELFVWHIRTPGVEAIELKSAEVVALRCYDLPYSRYVHTERGLVAPEVA